VAAPVHTNLGGALPNLGKKSILRADYEDRGTLRDTPPDIPLKQTTALYSLLFRPRVMLARNHRR